MIGFHIVSLVENKFGNLYFFLVLNIITHIFSREFELF